MLSRDTSRRLAPCSLLLAVPRRKWPRSCITADVERVARVASASAMLRTMRRDFEDCHAQRTVSGGSADLGRSGPGPSAGRSKATFGWTFSDGVGGQGVAGDGTTTGRSRDSLVHGEVGARDEHAEVVRLTAAVVARSERDEHQDGRDMAVQTYHGIRIQLARLDSVVRPCLRVSGATASRQ